MTRQVFALDLVDQPDLIAAYEARHTPHAVWSEVVRDIRDRGYREMEIWRVADRLVMIAEVVAGGPAPGDPALQPAVERWEAEMSRYQQPILPGGPKWAAMARIFALGEQASP